MAAPVDASDNECNGGFCANHVTASFILPFFANFTYFLKSDVCLTEATDGSLHTDNMFYFKFLNSKHTCNCTKVFSELVNLKKLSEFVTAKLGYNCSSTFGKSENLTL